MRPSGWRGWAFAAPALAWTVALFVVPLGVLAVYSLWQRSGTRLVRDPSLANYEAFFGREHFVQALTGSIEVTLITVVVSVLIAYPFAHLLAYRVPARWQRAALVVAILPFWTSYVVRSYSWLLVLADQGIINQALLAVGVVDEPLTLVNHRGATVLGFVHFFTMLLTLTIYANLVQIPESYRRAAADLGASGWQIFVRVTLPLSVPGVMVGAFLTFVLAIGDYVTPQILGGSRELLMPQVIMLQIQRRADFPMASAMSLILMVVVTAAFLACARWLRMERV